MDAEYHKILLDNNAKLGDSGHVKHILKSLGLKAPPPGRQWLYGRFDGHTVNELIDFLSNYSGKTIIPEEQEAFAISLKQMYQKAFGRGKSDRADREWGATTIKRRLAAKDVGFALTAGNSQEWLITQFAR